MLKKIKLKKIIEWGTYLLIFLLPWQARWIHKLGQLNKGGWEYGTQSLYALEIFWAVLVILVLILFFKRLKGKKLSLKNIFRRENFLPLVLFGFFIWSLLTIIWALDRNLAFYRNTILIEGIVLFFLVAGFVSQRRVAIVLVMSAALQSLLGCYQFLSQSIFGSKWLGMASQTASDLGVSVVEFADQRWLRAYGSLPHPNTLAAFLVVALILLLYLSQLSQTRSQRWFVALSWLIIIPGLIFTFSRAAWLAGVICILGYLVISLSYKKYQENFKFGGQLIILGLILAIIISFLVWPQISTRLLGTGRLDIMSNQDRLALYQQSQILVKDNWFQGVGLGNYTLAVYQQINSNWPAWAYQPVHNVYVLILAELGVVGLLLYLFVIFYLLFLTKANWIFKLAFLTLFIVGLFDHFLWSLYFGVMLWWLVAGLMKTKN